MTMGGRDQKGVCRQSVYPPQAGRVHWQIKPRRIVKCEDRAIPADRQVSESPQVTGRNTTADNGGQVRDPGCDVFQL